MGRILIAGIGNVFLGDDGFGVEVVRQLAGCDMPEGVEVMDVGIRGMDLAYALLDDYDAVIFVDLAARGGAPGTLYLIDPGMAGEGELSIDTHGMDPVKVLSFAQALGAGPRPTYIVACEPQRVLNPDVDQDVLMELSEPVRLAVPEAVRMVESLVRDLAIKEGKVDSELEQNLQVKGGVV